MPNILPPLHIDNVPIKREFVTTFLRVYLGENISWKHHINIVKTKPVRVLEHFTELVAYFTNFYGNNFIFLL